MARRSADQLCGCACECGQDDCVTCIFQRGHNLLDKICLSYAASAGYEYIFSAHAAIERFLLALCKPHILTCLSVSKSCQRQLFELLINSRLELFFEDLDTCLQPCVLLVSRPQLCGKFVFFFCHGVCHGKGRVFLGV